MTQYTTYLRRASDEDWRRIGLVARYTEACKIADIWLGQVIKTWPDTQVCVKDSNGDTLYMRP